MPALKREDRLDSERKSPSLGTSATSDRLQSIDVLRGIAAMAVIAYHYDGMSRVEWPNHSLDVAAEHLQLGLMGVELFFILSGFVILHSLEKIPDLRRFLIGRIARLYPAYVVSVLLSAVFLLSIGAATPLQAMINVTMLQKLVGCQNLITPYWTLTYELLFYALMGIIVWLGLITKIEYLSIVWLLAAHLTRAANIELNAWQSFITMIHFGHLFIAGMMIHRLVAGHRSLVTLSALILAISYCSFGRNDWAQIAPPTYFLVNALFIVIVLWAATTSAHPPAYLVRIGQLSYSLYLLHVPICLVLVWTADWLSLSRIFAIATAVPASFGSAYLSRRFIEIPGQFFVTEVVYGGLRQARSLIRPATNDLFRK
ncbi:acyltransferase [Bradyrhizobium diazoefficiens]|nr:acyltransferase [Bradyrhizobium diazoefficiens]MBR0703701.1 acyltransferase [Bradyrhizobium diazoefficiens]MBR0772457.1 acyltransferase [Bradyrhizobium diazoefficiens]